MKKLLPLLFLLSMCQPANAQLERLNDEGRAILKNYEDTLFILSYTVVNDSIPENRFASCQKLITTLVKALKIRNSFEYAFERMKSVSILYSPDSSFRIFTWQLYVDINEYRYYGAIQMNTPELKLYPLIDRSFEVKDPEHEVLSPEKWYGGIYYNIHNFETPKGRHYLLFGYDAYSFFAKRKFADVLSFSEGKVLFGAPVFVETSKESGIRNIRKRLVKEYSSEASFKFNFDQTYNMIVFDHLTPAAGNYGQGLANVPDGTYEGYKLQKGTWNWVEQVFTGTMEEAPIPEPILDGRKEKDILGKTKKKKNG
jgi:hypothetical protein